jgi:hypothetical protein
MTVVPLDGADEVVSDRAVCDDGGIEVEGVGAVFCANAGAAQI